MRFSYSFQFAAGFAAALALVAAILGGVWWVQVKYERDLIPEHDRLLDSAIQLAEAESALWQLRYGFPQFVVGDAQLRAKILEEEPKWYAVIKARLDAYEKAARSDEERVQLTELRTEYTRYIEARPKFFELYAAGRTEEALAWRTLTTTPYGAATVRAFERQIAAQRAAHEAVEAREKKEIALLRAVIVAVSAALVALLVAAFWMFRRLLRPVVALRAEAERVVQERLGRTLERNGTANEMAALESSFREMTHGLGEHAGHLEAARARLEALTQDLERRVTERTAALEERQRETEGLAELSNLLQAAEGMDDAAQVLPRLLGRLLAPHRGAVYLVKASLNYLDRVGAFGEACDCAPTIAPADCWALRRGQLYGALNPERDIFCAHVSPQGVPGGYVCVPMQARGAPVGLLHVVLDAQATDKEARKALRATLRRLAEQVAVGLANLKLRETLREQSIRDALTGLFNRRYLEESLERELARAKREARPLAVFMLDADHFKRFNDTHGHDAGDAVLRALGVVLRQSARAGDIVCRFGGEEFTAVLPGATPEQARDWALRLLQRVRALAVKSGGQTLPAVTISLGLACHPGDGEDVETLLQAADFALYEAKRAGRNRLALAGENPGQTTFSESSREG